MKLSVIIANFNKKDLLCGLLRSIQKHAKDITHEVIVVDSASTDESAQMIENNFPKARLIRLCVNRGCCPAYNEGFKIASGEYICFMHEDTVVCENAFQGLIEFLDQNPKAGYAGPANLDAQGNVIRTTNRFHTPLYNIFFSYKHFAAKFIKKNKKTRFKRFIASPRKADWMQLSCVMVKRSALAGPELFPNHMMEWWDDPFLQYKIHKSGWLGYYVPKAKIMHYKCLSAQRKRASENVAPIENLWVYSKYQYFEYFYGKIPTVIVKCNDAILFLADLVINLLKYFINSADINAKWEVNLRIGFLKCLLKIKDSPQKL